jgi:endoglucanase
MAEFQTHKHKATQAPYTSDMVTAYNDDGLTIIGLRLSEIDSDQTINFKHNDKFISVRKKLQYAKLPRQNQAAIITADNLLTYFDVRAGEPDNVSSGTILAQVSKAQEDIVRTTTLKANPTNAALNALVPIGFTGTFTVINTITDSNLNKIETTYRRIAEQTNWDIVNTKTIERVLRGINSAGAEFAHTAATLPGTYGADYSYDTTPSIQFLKTKGHEVIRLPFRWERLQPTREAAFNTTELNRIKAFVAACKAEGMKVILDVHNYARFINSTANGGAELTLGTDLPTSSVIDLWVRLSNEFKNESAIYAYGLMNEPHSLQPVSGSGAREESKVWEKISQELVTAIRNNEDKQLIMVGGFQYSSAKNWKINHPASWISDPLNNFIYEAHYYFDQDNSGQYNNSYAFENALAITNGYINLQDRAVKELSNFTTWLESKQVRGFIGEIGWPQDPNYNAVGLACYELLNQASVGVTYWATGERWGTGYPISAYTGTPLATSNTQAAVLEQNASFNSVKKQTFSETDPVFIQALSTSTTLIENSDSKVATQKATKAYVDGKVGMSIVAPITTSTTLPIFGLQRIILVTANSATVPITVTLPLAANQIAPIYIARNDYNPSFLARIVTQGADKIHNATTFDLETGTSLSDNYMLIPVTGGYVIN